MLRSVGLVHFPAVHLYHPRMEHPKLKWEAVQVELRAKLCAKDDDGEDFSSGKSKRYIGGVDISFSAIDSSVACATLNC